MTDSEFKNMVEKCVREISDSYGITEDKGFVLFSASNVLGIDEEIAFDAVLMGGKSDLGLDFGYIDERDREVTMIQGKYSEVITRDIIRGLEALPEVLADNKRVNEAEANTMVREFARDYRRVLKKGFTLNNYLFHWGNISPALESEIDKVVYYGMKEMKHDYEERQSIVLAKRPKRIDIELYLTDHFLQLPDVPSSPRCLLGALSLKTLWNLYQEHKSGLFDDNIRLHAGDKTAANRSMYATLVDNAGTDAGNFIFYNNGITILCDAFKHKKEKQKRTTRKQRPVFVLENPQIINGAQTTYTVGKLDVEDICEGAAVLVRILCPPKKNQSEFREKVIRCNNTQTPVTSRDFRSNDEIQKKIFDTLSKWNPSYFYQRKLGLWDALPRRDRARFKRKGKRAGRPNYRIIDNEVMAQCILAWDGRPAAAKNEKRLIFIRKSENGIYEDIFPEDCYETDQCRYYVVAYELNNLFIGIRKEWSKDLKKMQDVGDEESIKRIESGRFVTHFNFFGIASIGYIFEKYLCARKKIDPMILIEKKYFEKIFHFLKVVFGTELRACQRAADKLELFLTSIIGSRLI